MRILFNAFSACRRRTGVGCYAKNLLEALRNHAGDQVHAFPTGLFAAATRVGSSVVAPRRASKPAASHELPRGIAKLRNRVDGIFRAVGRNLCERGFQRASQQDCYDLYHEPNFVPWPSDIPVAATVHDLSAILHPEWHPRDRAQFHEIRFQRGLNQCEHLLVDSDCIRGELIRHCGVSPRRVTRIYLGRGDEFRPLTEPECAPVLKRHNLPESYLLFVGTIEPRKNLLTLLRAYCDLPGAIRSSCPLVLVGMWGWNFAPIWNYYESTAKHRDVMHLGYVSDADRVAIYNRARALVYPSYYEGFGLPPIEMMACGGPVLASTAPALREVCGRHAYYLDPDDLVGWRDAMRRIIEDDDWHSQQLVGVRQHAAKYSWQQCAEETFAAYGRIVRGETSPQRAAA